MPPSTRRLSNGEEPTVDNFCRARGIILREGQSFENWAVSIGLHHSSDPEAFLNCGAPYCRDIGAVLEYLHNTELSAMPAIDLEEIMPQPTSEMKEITHFEMELSKTPEGTKVFIKSPFVEALMNKLSSGMLQEVGIGEGWPGYSESGVARAYRIPNPPMYIAGIGNNWQYFQYPIVWSGFNPACLRLQGLKDGLTFQVREPMSREAQDVFADMVGSCIKQLIEGFGNTSSKRAVRVMGKDDLEPNISTRRRGVY